MSDQRPGLDDLKVGDLVHVRTYSTYFPDYRARVVKINRVWIEMTRDVGYTPSYVPTLRFRKDTQRTGYESTADWFETEEQYAWSIREAAAREFLKEQRIDVFSGPWAGRRLELANALRALLGLEAL